MEVKKIKEDWYQTESDVVVNILAKNLKKEDVKVDFKEDRVIVEAKLSDGSEYTREFNTLKKIKTDSCLFKVLTSKIEIKLRKLDASQWTSLEIVAEKEEDKEKKPSYPTSSKNKVDWDKAEKEFSKEVEKDEENDINHLFSKIYNSGDENTKKAMLKSMQESGGTVLSTNWEEVGAKKIDVSPPDGMEWKKWDESAADAANKNQKNDDDDN